MQTPGFVLRPVAIFSLEKALGTAATLRRQG
jgi:hypothetical protein